MNRKHIGWNHFSKILAVSACVLLLLLPSVHSLGHGLQSPEFLHSGSVFAGNQELHHEGNSDTDIIHCHGCIQLVALPLTLVILLRPEWLMISIASPKVSCLFAQHSLLPPPKG